MSKIKLPNVNDRELEKFKTNLENLKNAKAVTILFSLRYFETVCVNSGYENKQYCYYFFLTEGHQILIDLVKQFEDKEQISFILLSIINSCLKEFGNDEYSLKFGDSRITEYLIKINKNSTSGECRKLSLEILNKLSIFEINHKMMIDQGFMHFLDKSIEAYSKTDLKTLKKEDMIKIGQLLEIVKNIAKNADHISFLSSSGIINDILAFYTQNSDISYIRDLFVNCFVNITENEEVIEELNNSNLDIIQLAQNSIKSRNHHLIKMTKKLLNNLSNENNTKEKIEESKKKDCDPNLIIYLSFLSFNEIYYKYFEDQEFIDSLLDKLKDTTANEELKYAILRISNDVIRIEEKNIEKFGLNIILDILENDNILKQDDYYFTIELLKLFSKFLRIKREKVAEILDEQKIFTKFEKYFFSLSNQFKEFKIKDMNTEKALDSIEYHKSEVSKVLLLGMKTINEKNIVNMQLAINFISCEKLSVNLMNFFKELFIIDPVLILHENFFEHCLNLMGIFKNSKKIHEYVINCLNKLTYTKKYGRTINDLNFDNYLCNRFWLNPDWKIFSFYILNFYEVLLKNEDCLILFRSSYSSVKLIASIKNFINESEYQNFEKNLEEEEKEEEEETENKADFLTFSEERELNHKSMQIMTKLLDVSTIKTFKNTITNLISKFKPVKETILILRAEYAVLTCANGINHWGIEGLNADHHLWLEENIKLIEKSVNNKYFTDKEKLIGDCIKCIANYICITWNENGKNIYQQKEVSLIVFGFLEEYLKKSDWPLKSYVILQVFKQWLIERIEIIENTNNLVRTKIYDSNNFMMVNEKIRDKIITDVMDVLYLTQQRFGTNEKVTKLNFEVILLLGYIYPDWKFKIGKNFIPLILEALQSDFLPESVDFNSIDLLKHLAGVDGKSTEPVKEMLETIAKKNGVQILTKSISDNGFNDKYIEHCRPLLESLSKIDESHLETACLNVENLIEELNTFNKSGDKTNIQELTRMISVNDQINAYIIMAPLRVEALSLNHPEVVNEFMKNCSVAISQSDDPNLKNILKRVQSGSTVSNYQYLNSNISEENKQNYLNSQNIIENAFITLLDNKKNSYLVLLNSKIINSFFPSENEEEIKNLAREMKFQPILEKIYTNFSKNSDPEIVNEVSNLYMNLSEVQNEEMIDRVVNKNVKKLKNSVQNNNMKNCNKNIDSLIPFIHNSNFIDKFEELEIEKLILKMLDELETSMVKKTGKNITESVKSALSNKNPPDLASNQKNLLQEEIKLANNIYAFIDKFPEVLKTKIFKNKELAQKVGIIGFLNGNPEIFELFKNLLNEPYNIEIMKKNQIFECATYLLMKNNKDALKKEEIGEELMKSTLSHLPREEVNISNISKSQVVMKKVDDSKEDEINRNIEEYGDLVEILLEKNLMDDLIKKYIRALKSYVNENGETEVNLLMISRMLLAVVMTGVDESLVNFSPFTNELVKSYDIFFSEFNKEKTGKKKLLIFFEKIFNYLLKSVKNPNAFKNGNLWNHLITRYFVLTPGFVKNNAIMIFENLNRTIPENTEKIIGCDKFIESVAEIYLYPEMTERGSLSDTNFLKSNQIVSNYYKVFTHVVIPDEYVLNNLECLARSATFCGDFVKSAYFEKFFTNLEKSLNSNSPSTFNQHCDTMFNIAISLMIQKIKNNQKGLTDFYRFPTERLLKPFFENVRSQNDKYFHQSLKVLNYFDKLIKNKTLYFDEGLPDILINYLGEDWSGKEEAVILLCKSLTHSGLNKKFNEFGLFNKMRNELEKDLFGEKSIIKNGNFSNYRNISNLNEEPQKRLIELKCYIFGELSRDEKNAASLVDLGEPNLKNVFELFEQFIRYGHITIIGTELIQAMRNGVYQLSEEQLETSQEKVTEIIQQLPSQITKYSSFKLTVKYLQEILDFLKSYNNDRIPKSALGRIMKNIMNNKLPADFLKDLKEVVEIYKEINEQLKREGLANKEAKILEILNDELLNIIKTPNSEAPYVLINLGFGNTLVDIAQSPNSSLIQKVDVFELLEEFAKNIEITDKMLEGNFYVDNSSSILHEQLQKTENLKSVIEIEMDLINKLLSFLRLLSENKKSAEIILNPENRATQLVEDIYTVLLSKNENEKIKKECLRIIKNLMQNGNDEELDEKMIVSLDFLLDTNVNLYNLFTELIMLTNTIAEKSDDRKTDLINKDILKNIKKGMQKYIEGKELNLKIAILVRTLTNDNTDDFKYIFDSNILVTLSNAYINKDELKETYENISQILLNMTYDNKNTKIRLTNFEFLKGCVYLFGKYSSPEFYDKDMVTLLLKCMANFSVIAEGRKILLEDKIVLEFRKFFKRYKLKLPEQNKLVLATISNISYEPNEAFIEIILKEKGGELILEAMEFYIKQKNEEITEIAIDALTHISVAPQTLKYLKSNATNVIDILVDILREQSNDELVYKALKCLTKFSDFKPLSDRLIEKNGHTIAVDLFKHFCEDFKIIFQTLKLLNNLASKYEDTLDDFSNCGIPEKIITVFKPDWHSEIIKEMIELFKKLAVLEFVKDILADKYLDYLIKIMMDNIKNRYIVGNGIKLLVMCSDNISSVDIIQQAEGNKLVDEILQKYLSSEKISLDCLYFMENMLKMNDSSKEEFLALKTDLKIENIIQTTDADLQFEIHSKAQELMRLLRNEMLEIIENSEFEESVNQNNIEEPAKNANNNNFPVNAIVSKIPQEMQKFLTMGQILRVYDEDGVCKSMHFFLSKDLLDIRCKNPKDDVVKPKWMIPVHMVKEVKYGYEENSPIARSASFFRQAPLPEKCFAVFGPTELEGPKNFHCLCRNNFNSRQWFNYLSLVVKTYKDTQIQNLKKKKK